MTALLPDDAQDALLIGRVWDPVVAGPSPVVVRDGELIDLSGAFPTVRDLLESGDAVASATAASGPSLGPVADIAENSRPGDRDPARPWLLSPLDLQVVKASGVTFAVSMLERVIEERSMGDASLAAQHRGRIVELIGADLKALKPGSDAAAALKQHLIAEGIWSQYLEVGIGPDAEIFTKSPVLGTVGWGAQVGVLPASTWNNPEPEVVLVTDSRGRIAGATLGNDVNLRDIEGRSALLLGKAKDNRAAAAVGPFIRLLDDGFTLDDVRGAHIDLVVEGTDGFRLAGSSTMTQISRDPADLVGQLFGGHDYPDGAALFLGTLFAPVQDRDEPGRGFTHHTGDVVTISSERLGSLVNEVRPTDEVERWSMGIGDLMRNLSGRGLL